MLLSPLFDSLTDSNMHFKAYGRSILPFLISTYQNYLQVGKFAKDFGGGMFHFEILKDCGAIVGDSDVAHIVDQHFVQPDRTERRFHNVGDGLYRERAAFNN